MLRSALRTGRTLATQAGRRGMASEPTRIADALGGAKVTLPCPVYGVGGRYASALYVSASKAGVLDKVVAELKVFKDAYETQEDLKRFIKDPTLKRKAKADAMKQIMKNSDAVLKNFTGVLCDNGRMDQIEDVMSEFTKLMNAHNKQVFATVTTVYPLSAMEADAVREALQGFVKSDETLNITQEIDPEILGGMVCAVGDKRIDLSVLARIKELERAMEAAIA
uniref:ATP synthase subunit O, mitochondrial n=1 Tax=Hemiselmis andersenii TaxID=464988 RepID=A0A6U5B0V4_HEMAN